MNIPQNWLWWWRNRHSDSLGAVPPAAEGGRPGGDGSGPLAAPRRDMPDTACIAAPVEWETARRWRDALAWISRGMCHEFDYSTCASAELPFVQWCDHCMAYAVLRGAEPPDSSPQPDPLRSEAARPEPSRDGDLGGPGRATNFP